MANRHDIMIKWGTYSAVSLFLLFLHLMALSKLSFYGVVPFLPPILLAVIASQESMTDALYFSLLFGILCDLTLCSPLPCLYTLSMPLAAFCCSLLAKGVVQPGFFCSLLSSFVTFFLIDLFIAAALLFGGHAALFGIASRAALELLLSLPLLAFCFPIFSFMHRFFTV